MPPRADARESPSTIPYYPILKIFRCCHCCLFAVSVGPISEIYEKSFSVPAELVVSLLWIPFSYDPRDLSGSHAEQRVVVKAANDKLILINCFRILSVSQLVAGQIAESGSCCP